MVCIHSNQQEEERVLIFSGAMEMYELSVLVRGATSWAVSEIKYKRKYWLVGEASGPWKEHTLS